MFNCHGPIGSMAFENLLGKPNVAIFKRLNHNFNCQVQGIFELPDPSLVPEFAPSVSLSDEWYVVMDPV